MNTLEASVEVNKRILIIDDNPSIHDDFRKVLCGSVDEALKELEDDEEALFGEAKSTVSVSDFELTSAYQGQEGLEAVRAAAQAGRPFALAFVDIRMPPGWDGIETIVQIWKEFPDLQFVICTAYSDYSWQEIIGAIGTTDSVLILKKPFDSVEVLQLAHALTKKWLLGRMAQKQVAELDHMVNQRTAELTAMNEQLKREVNERALAENALRQSEERFSKAFRSSPVPMLIEDLANGAIIDVNESFLRMTGYSTSDLLNNPGMSSAVWQNAATPVQLREAVLQGRPPRGLHTGLRTKTAGHREAIIYSELIELSGNPHMLLITQDVTEQKLLEDQLRQAQKMESVGRLAAGIAHDFNNILTVIIGNTSLQLTSGNLTETTSKALRQVSEAADRAASLTRQLLAYSRQQIIQRSVVNLNDQLTQTSAMLRRVIGEDIALTTNFADGFTPILADPSNVDQVFMNLIFNARDAMPSGGRLDVSTAHVDITAADVANKPEVIAGEYVRLTVQDTGHGIDAATMSRIFEPFFTTKEQGRGTGMGLATTFGIVKQHGGWIEVQSEVSAGTTFHVYFPKHKGAVSGIVSPVEESDEAVTAGEGTVLVVEDEETVRMFVVEVLGSLGYRVLSAANGAEAIDIWKREKDSIDLLLTDVVMPESISGCQIAQRFQQDKRTLNVILTSGYSPELLDMDLKTEVNAKFLSKPYHSDRLAKMVASCFSERVAYAD